MKHKEKDEIFFERDKMDSQSKLKVYEKKNIYIYKFLHFKTKK